MIEISKPKCADCKFFESNGGYGVCRRFPPQLASDNGEPYTVFPHLKEDDWCGEHQKKDEVFIYDGNAPRPYFLNGKML